MRLQVIAGKRVGAVLAALVIGLAAAPLRAQPAPVDGSAVANNPDVKGAQRLFSAWLEGQVAFRNLRIKKL